MSNLKVLFFDLETIVKPFTSGGKLRAEDTSIAVFLYAWGEQGEVKAIHLGQFPEDYKKDPFNDKKLLTAAAEVMLEADVVVAHYGSGFDKPLLRTRFILNGLLDAAQHLQKIKMIDTCILARQIYRVRSSSLRYLCKLLGLTEKLDSDNSFWVGVMRSEKEAIENMVRYGKGDVQSTRELYFHERRFMPNHPAFNLNDKDSCPVCCSTWIIKAKKPMLYLKGMYERLHCRKCGTDSRGKKLKAEPEVTDDVEEFSAEEHLLNLKHQGK